MLVGYARVSTLEQDTAMQQTQLKRAGCAIIFEEKRSAIKARPELERALSRLKRGDVLVVYKLDRVARSLAHLLQVLERLEKIGAGLKSLTEPVDTNTPSGMFMLQVLGAAAQFERSLIRERAIAGMVEAYRRGVRFGTPRKFTEEQIEDMKKARERGLSWAALGRMYGVCPMTAKRYVTNDSRAFLPVLRKYL